MSQNIPGQKIYFDAINECKRSTNAIHKIMKFDSRFEIRFTRHIKTHIGTWNPVLLCSSVSNTGITDTFYCLNICIIYTFYLF